MRRRPSRGDVGFNVPQSQCLDHVPGSSEDKKLKSRKGFFLITRQVGSGPACWSRFEGGQPDCSNATPARNRAHGQTSKANRRTPLEQAQARYLSFDPVGNLGRPFPRFAGHSLNLALAVINRHAIYRNDICSTVQFSSDRVQQPCRSLMVKMQHKKPRPATGNSPRTGHWQC